MAEKAEKAKITNENEHRNQELELELNENEEDPDDSGADAEDDLQGRYFVGAGQQPRYREV